MRNSPASAANFFKEDYCMRKASALVVLLLAVGLMGWAAGTTESNTKSAPAAPAAAATVAKGEAITYEGKVTGCLPLVDKPITLTYWVPFKEDTAKIMSSFAEIEMFKVMAKKTGITLKFIHPPLKQEAENFKLMVASRDYPDIVELTYQKADLYPGGPDQAIKDGVFLRLNELVDQYAPNYKAIMKFSPAMERSLKTDTGNLFAFQMIEKVVQPAYGGPAVRQDWLDDLGIATPQTMDDWYLMLKAFKEKKGATAPLLMEKNAGADGYFAFISAYGVIADFYRDETVAKYGPVEEGFRQYLATMNKWYVEGLIDRDFLSWDGQTGANTLKKFSTGQAGAIETGFYSFGRYEITSTDPKLKLVGVPYPALKKGDVVKMRQYNEHVRGDPTFVTKASKYPVEAVKLLDYNYSDQGTLYCNYGVEGQSYTMVNGKPQYTDFVKNNPAFPGSIVTTIACRHEGPFIRDYARTYFSYKQNALDAMNLIWNGDQSGMMPKTLALTAEEGTRLSTIMSDIKTYVWEMMPKFIMGVEPMGKFDAFVAQIKKMGIDDAIRIKQASLTRYFKR
jgi:putative aldouronate transport system substrate-binding protein